jgi:hypothetical protein
MDRPEMRNHILLQPSQYLPDEFADLFSKNVRFLWPGSLQDLSVLNTATGMHEFSELFNSSFRNRGCWTLCIDFFIRYPELIGIIPIYNPIPRSLSLNISQETSAMVAEENLGVCDWPIDESGYLDSAWMS